MKAEAEAFEAAFFPALVFALFNRASSLPSLIIPDEDIREGLARFERAVAAVVEAK